LRTHSENEKDATRMRLIGRLPDQKSARHFGAWLGSRDIAGQVESSQQGDWMIWIEEEERLAEAAQALDRFLCDPKAEEFRVGRQAAPPPVAKNETPPRQPSRARNVDVRTQWHRDQFAFNFPVTLGLILVSVGVTVASSMGNDRAFLRPLFIAGPWVPLTRLLRQGQAWRLITPIFIHFGVLHVLFNMWWMWDLGRMIEPKRGSLYFALLVVTIAIPSNLLQYWATGPQFGGMSGVVFGLIGYIWIRNRFSYQMEYPLNPQNVRLALIWMVLCVLGLVGTIANWAHGGGMAVGMLWGYLASDRFRRLFVKR
jgi:GlpG protein